MKFVRILTIFFIISWVNRSIANNISYSPLNINKVVTFACPQIDDSHILIYPSACNAADGSITGITGTDGTGAFSFKWYDANNNVVGTTADLLNVPPGTYTLQFHDGSKCLPVTKTYTVGQRNTIVINESQIKITPAGCNAKDGAVTGLNISNAAQYQWFDASNKLIAAAPDLKNVGSGYYKLTMTSPDGCSTSKTYQVPSAVFFPKVTKIDTITGTCGGNAGSIILTFNPAPTDPGFSYSIYNSQNLKQISEGNILYNAGTPIKVTIPILSANAFYGIELTSPDNCQEVLGQYTLPQPVFKILNGPFFLVRNDACGRHTGAVIGLALSGETLPAEPYGNPPPQRWTWTDSLGTVVGNLPDLLSVGRGTYTLTVKDISGCSDTRTFAVLDSTAEALPPGINGATLCLPGTVNLSIINPSPKYKYKLYDSTQSTEIAENAAGLFQVKVTHTTKYYATTVNGLCESDETPVTVTVIAPGVIIPNAFTPNNDGVNDYWDIPHINDFPGAEISIFTRDGQPVFHSIDYSHPFNGNYSGKKLPVGTYYYVIDLKQPECFGKISGSLTIIR